MVEGLMMRGETRDEKRAISRRVQRCSSSELKFADDLGRHSL